MLLRERLSSTTTGLDTEITVIDMTEVMGTAGDAVATEAAAAFQSAAEVHKSTSDFKNTRQTASNT